MNAHASIHAFRRRQLEARIEEMIALLDLLDGDPDIEANGDELDEGMPWNWCCSRRYGETVREDDEDGGDVEPEETDQNGDEQDSSRSEDDNVYGGSFAMGNLEGGRGL